MVKCTTGCSTPLAWLSKTLVAFEKHWLHLWTKVSLGVGCVYFYVCKVGGFIRQHSTWITLLLLFTSAPLVLCCDRFDRGSRQVQHDLVDIVMEYHDNTTLADMYAGGFLWPTNLDSIQLFIPFKRRFSTSVCFQNIWQIATTHNPYIFKAEKQTHHVLLVSCPKKAFVRWKPFFFFFFFFFF